MIEKKRATAATVTQGVEPYQNGPKRLYHNKMIQEWITPILLAAVADFVLLILPWLVVAYINGVL